MKGRKKQSNKKNVQNTGECSCSADSFDYASLPAQATPTSLTSRNNEAKAALDKIVDVLSTNKNGDTTLEQGLQPEIHLLRNEIISSGTRLNILLSNKTKLSELQDRNNNLQEHHENELKKLNESLNNYKKSVVNQVKFIENMGKKAENHESEINELQSKINQLQSENKTLKTDLQKARKEIENLKAIGEDMSVQMGELSL